MSNNDLQTDNELLIHLREELEARNIIGSDYVLDTMLDGVLHHSMISYDFTDVCQGSVPCQDFDCLHLTYCLQR